MTCFYCYYFIDESPIELCLERNNSCLVKVVCLDDNMPFFIFSGFPMLCFRFFVVIIAEMELETFKITVLPLRDKLINISWRMMEDRSDAEDIVQETFLKLWQIREKLDGYNSVEALAVQVAKNLALDKLKQHRPEGMDITSLSLDSGTRNPAEELEQHDTVDRIVG